MLRRKNKLLNYVFFILLFLVTQHSFAQKTVIRGFVDVLANYEKGKFGFGLGEQDLFITSELNDRISFIGESVFKFSVSSPTQFNVSIERVVFKYNFYGNHNLLVGKVHTPVNYWNYTYHHGRVLFPTIERPLLFSADIIPLHNTGIGLQGQNFGPQKFGYDLFVGNGIGASEINDNDNRKSVTAGVHISPRDGLTVGVSYYNDEVAKGAHMHEGRTNLYDVKQSLYSGSVAYFGKKFELLAEGTLGNNYSDTTGSKGTFAGYLYAGIKIKEKLVPYIRFDNITYKSGEVYYRNNNLAAAIAGLRYEINYLSVVKLEFKHSYAEIGGKSDRVSAQFAIGF
ncbi:MAG: hypothetical protein JWR18_2339 [Segetibacter sp.]|jgi:hypothetical protein|nr:hypothetical protein [Segetibacter sp.]